MKKRYNIEGITINPRTRFGKPVLAGTRVPIELVVGKIAGGMAVEKVMAEYDLTKKQVLTALRYAAKIIASEDVAVV